MNVAVGISLAVMFCVFNVLLSFETTASIGDAGRVLDHPTTSKPQVSTALSLTSQKYIKYAATSGWANQLKSMEHAFWIAHATNRVLILPPAQYHHDVIQFSFSGRNMDQVYRKLVDKCAPMTRILDFNWTMVQVIDYTDYLKRRERQKLSLSERRLIKDLPAKRSSTHRMDIDGDNGFFNCANTRFTNNKSLHLHEVTNITCQDHLGLNDGEPKTFTYRHIATALEPYDSYQVWTFQFIFPESLFDTDSMEPAFQVHYRPIIQQAALKLKHSWPGKHYAAVHIRSADGPFKTQNWDHVFPKSLEIVKESIQDYHKEHVLDKLPVGSRSAQPLTNYTLLIISDSEELNKRTNVTKKNKPALLGKWLRYEAQLERDLLREYNIVLHKRTKASYRLVVEELRQQTSSREADVYLDQQLAACADLGFGHATPGSSFQQLILSMRQQHKSPCLG